MFFRVLSAMLTADAIDRRIRRQQPRYWYPQAPPNHASCHRPGQPSAAVRRPRIRAAPAWDPRAPERPW